MAIWGLLYRHRWVLQAMVMREIASRYAGSVFGLIWLVIYPLAFLSLYSYVYLQIFVIQGQKLPVNEYLLLIYCGLVPFLSIAECMSAGTPSVVSNRDIVTATLFPAELLPVRYAGASLAVLIVGLSLLLPVAWSQGMWHPTQLLLPVAVIIQLVFMIGIAWIFSTIYVFFRDFGQIVSLLILMLMLVSPIAFDRTMLPVQIQTITAFNPLFPFMEMYRGLMLRGTVPWFDMALSLTIALGTFHIGAFLFSRLKIAFDDYI